MTKPLTAHLAKRLKPHPLTNVLPSMREEEYKSLREDILRHGILEPITLHKGRIIDGRARHRAFLELLEGASPPDILDTRLATKTLAGSWGCPPNKLHIVGCIISMNMQRRNLTATQKAFVALNTLPELQIEARERQRSGKKLPEGEKGESVVQAAKIVGVNPSYIKKAKAIAEKNPELAAKGLAGKESIQALYQQLTNRKVQSRNVKAERDSIVYASAKLRGLLKERDWSGDDVVIEELKSLSKEIAGIIKVSKDRRLEAAA